MEGAQGPWLEQLASAMTQDTRKDRRVKIVSLNVRYKSATVDEFIEGLALDVSRGGIYIKTSNPFPPGTLLKFEIPLASDHTVITGVGRVVWKREPAQSATDRPVGMGVKFIKMDEASRAVVERLTSTRDGAGPEAAAARTPSRPPPQASPPPPGASRRPARPDSAKSTMIGLGAPVTVPPRVGAPPRPGPPAQTQAMFPKGSGEQLPKTEQTMIKQASELLEEALRQAGGSLEEVGTNPLFTAKAAAPVAAIDPALAASPAPAAPALAPADDDAESTVALPATHPLAEATQSAAQVKPLATWQAPEPEVTRPSRRPEPRIARAIPTSNGSAKKSGGGASWVGVGALFALGFAGFAYRDRVMGALGMGDSSAPPAATSAVALSPTAPAPSAPEPVTLTEPASADAGADLLASSADAASPASGQVSSEAGAKLASAEAGAKTPARPKPAPRSSPAPKATAEWTGEGLDTASAELAPRAIATAGAASLPTATPSATATAGIGAARARPEDNPY
ncbi:MAG: TIGR02266 family protein [Polyangiaceae bacterium]|nr:TIGR02266 family protein [Polyangiaceae bacterium]